IKMMTAIRGVGSAESMELLEELIFDEDTPLAIRREAANAIGRSWSGENRVLELLRSNKLPENLKASAVNGVSSTWRRDVRAEAASFLDEGDNPKTNLPPIKELISMEGDKDNGMLVFQKNCAICHQVGDIGVD